MDSIFIEEVEDSVTIVYMDDILIYVTMLELLKEYTKWVLHKLWDHNLFLKAKKCELVQEWVEYVEYFISDKRISVDPRKVDTIKN